MATNKPLQSFVITDSTTTSVTFSNIDQTYTDLMLVSNIQTVGNATPTIQYNGNASGIYSETTMYGSGATSTVASGTATASQIDLTSWAQYVPTSGSFNTSVMHIFNYSNATTFKTALIRSAQSNDARINSSCWRSTDAITSLKITSASAFNPGTTFDLYGIKSGAPKAMGGDLVTTDGNYWYHTFRSSGTFLLQQPTSVDYLVVAGGGAGGGYGGGGGAGGFRTSAGTSGANSAAESALSMSPGSYTIVVGAGGAIVTSPVNGTGSQGSSSSISGTGITAVTSTGGGGGAGELPGNGGSGGGGSGTSSGTTVGLGTANQGRNGGQGSNDTVYYGGGGGGGAFAVGSNFASSTQGGAGGAGQASSISGSSVTYAGGGGGGTWYNYNGGAGGAGGGGAGSAPSATAGSGTANTGGGGGGSGSTGGSSGSLRTPGAGGSGIVIVRYAV